MKDLGKSGEKENLCGSMEAEKGWERGPLFLPTSVGKCL